MKFQFKSEILISNKLCVLKTKDWQKEQIYGDQKDTLYNKIYNNSWLTFKGHELFYDLAECECF